MIWSDERDIFTPAQRQGIPPTTPCHAVAPDSQTERHPRRQSHGGGRGGVPALSAVILAVCGYCNPALQATREDLTSARRCCHRFLPRDRDNSLSVRSPIRLLRRMPCPPPVRPRCSSRLPQGTPRGLLDALSSSCHRSSICL